MKSGLEKFEFDSDKILKDLSSKELELLDSRCTTLSFKKGKQIFYDGGIPTGAFILKKGRAKIFKTGSTGKDQIFYIYKSGDLFGYHALLCHEHYEDSCEVLENSDVLFIKASDFEWLRNEIPNFGELLMQNLSHEFGVLVNIIATYAQKSIRERLALHLLLLDRRYENNPITISREDLANLVGTARESLGRMLKEFKEDGLISVSHKDIKLENKPKLLRLAGAV